MTTSKKSSRIPMRPETKRALMSVSLVLFIDLVGFSIIFPLFPAMLQYYVDKQGQVGLLGWFLQLIAAFEHFAGTSSLAEKVPIVLFGGLLGSLYSILQFLFAPVWGTLSDRYGRKPILILSLIGIALSYVGWFFAGSFWILVLSRVISGIMGGNISTATAAVSDVTDERERSSGMAVIGIAFGMGFLIGPALGGLLSLLDLTKILPTWQLWGVNPFSTPAVFAFLITLLNLFYVIFSFRETLPAVKRGQAKSTRILNPLAFLETRQYPGVALTILSYFLFLTIFSGMEFSLTFLAAERLNFTPMDNGLMFIFIGVILALVQGGYVRRQAHRVGEKKMALQGIVLIIPGLLFLAFAHQVYFLYIGLSFLAVGTAMATPCLTSLVSLYSPMTEQGRVIGIFRSMGALARAVGPLIACVLYWRLSPTVAYGVGAALLILPLALGFKLPAVAKNRFDGLANVLPETENSAG